MVVVVGRVTQVGYDMFKTFNIKMEDAGTVLTNMCHLYEVRGRKP